MADTKVSDLPALNGADVDPADLLYIIDSSAGTAGSKKITVGQYQLAPYSAGTANGVMYLNGSNVVTTGSALTFDGTNLGIGTSSPGAKLETVVLGTAVYFSGGDSAVARRLQFAASTTTNTGDTQNLNALGSTGVLAFQTNSTERMRLDASGNLLVGTMSSGGYRLEVDGSAYFKTGSIAVIGIDPTSSSGGYGSATARTLGIAKNTTTGRSIGADGTINASGADYAEYMTKAGNFTVAKGDVVGIDAGGKLTNVFADAVAFVVKSTDPSYVGGDKWGVGFEGDSEGLEAARQQVDRIAFAGQVPVNVLGATPGQYIIPVNDNGAIKGAAISNPTFEQYQSAVGKIIAVEADGRARIIVKVA